MYCTLLLTRVECYHSALINKRCVWFFVLQGEGVQSFFNANAYARPPDGYHNEVNSRVKLRIYDPQLYLLVQRIFPCANNYMKRCNSRGEFSKYNHANLIN